MYKADEIIEKAITEKVSGGLVIEYLREQSNILEDEVQLLKEKLYFKEQKLLKLNDQFHFDKSRLHKPTVDKDFFAVAIPILWPLVLPFFILTKVFILFCALPVKISNWFLKLEGIKNTDEKELP